jgi:hypothetical protein
MKRTAFAMVALSAVLAACSGPTGGTDQPQVIELSSGTSFGMCAGYCITELIVEGTNARLIESSYMSVTHPPKTRTISLSVEEAERLYDLIDVAKIEQLEGVHGCPDCADGGAEWIQIRTVSDSIRVTFEYGDVLPPIAELQAAVRAQRERFRQ